MLSCLICLYGLLDLFGLLVLFQWLCRLLDLCRLFEWSESFRLFALNFGRPWTAWIVCTAGLFGMLDSLGCVNYFLDWVGLFWLFVLVVQCVGSPVCLYCVLDLFGPFGLCALFWLVFVRLSLLAFLVFCLSWLFGIVSAVPFLGFLVMFFTLLYKYDLDVFVGSFFIVFCIFLSIFGSRGSLGCHFGKLFGSQGALGNPF